MDVHETDQQRNHRIRNGRIVALLTLLWWTVSIGGIILTINLQS
jgi:hypothetical protein